MHSNADQLICCLHGNFIVSDVNELHFAAHLCHHFGIAPDVSIIKGRIHLIEHAEGRWIELEDGKHKGNSGECLFTTGEEVNSTVFLARWLRHNRDTGIEQVVASKGKIGITAAEHARK